MLRSFVKFLIIKRARMRIQLAQLSTAIPNNKGADRKRATDFGFFVCFSKMICNQNRK